MPAGEQNPSGASRLPQAFRYASWLNYAAFLIAVPLARQSSILQASLAASGQTSERGDLLFLFSLVSAWLGAMIGIGIVFLFSQGWADAYGNWSRHDEVKAQAHEADAGRSSPEARTEPDARSRENCALRALIASGIIVSGVANFVALKLATEDIARGIGASEAGASNGLFHGIAEVLRLLLIATGNLGLLLTATAVGLLVARGLLKPNYLVLAAIVGAVTDIFSVYAGPSKHLLTSQALPYVSYQWSVAGQGIIPCVGAGDFIFLSLYFAGARRFGLDERKTFVAMGAAFALGYASLLLSPGGIPALPFMAALLLLVHARELKTMLLHKDTSTVRLC